MKHHSKFGEVKTLVEAGINVLCVGPASSGKSTVIKQVAEALNLDFYSVPMTRQTTVSNLLGFIAINGNYIPSQFRKAVEFGGLVDLSEIDAADPNTLLCLNTLENGYIAFPDKIVEVHKDFRLCATANPIEGNSRYVGRNQLDEATLDRFDVVTIDIDSELEKAIVGEEVANTIKVLNNILDKCNISRRLSMRDAIRFKKRIDIGLGSGYEHVLLNDTVAGSMYNDYIIDLQNKPTKDSVNSIDDLWEYITQEEL